MAGPHSSAKFDASARPSVPRWQILSICLGLMAITFAVFGQTRHDPFVNYDDDVYVYENPIVAQGLTRQGVVWAFTGAHAYNWHPLTWLSHMLDCQMYGLRPAGHHLTNVILHTAAVIALFLVLRQMTGAFWRSAFVAAVFAIHPLRVESVAWVAERKDVLSGLFFMLTIGAYVHYVRRAWSICRYGLVVLLLALGLMSKPMLVTLPLVLLLLDYWPLRRTETPARLILEKLPLLALSAGSCAATFLAQNKILQSTQLFPVPLRFENALVACMVYLRQMIFPAGLVPFYPLSFNGLPPWEVALAAILVIGLSAFAWQQRRAQPWLLVGWLWYLVMLIPVVGIVQVGDQAHADRYTYLPLIGIYTGLTWCLAEWAGAQAMRRRILVVCMVGSVGALALCAWKQAGYWKKNDILWNRTIACTTNNYIAEFNLANILRMKGKMDDAIIHFKKTVQYRPDYWQAHNNLGKALLMEGKADEAIPHFETALQFSPGTAPVHVNLGEAFFRKGNPPEAIKQYQIALQIDPANPDALSDLGLALLAEGKAGDAIAPLQEALRLNPNNTEAYTGLGNILLQMGQVDDAINNFQKAVQLKPDSVQARNSLGAAFLKKGDTGEAIAQLQRVLELEPNDPQVQNNLAWVLATCPDPALRDGKRAVELAEQANRITGAGNPVIFCALAAAYAEAGRFHEAVEAADHALQMAKAQSKPGLARAIETEMKFYQEGQPFHSPVPTH